MFEQVFNHSMVLKNAPVEILQSTVKLLASEGFSVSLRQIARDAGVSPGLVVHHFGSRDELVNQAVGQTLEALFRRKSTLAQHLTESGAVELFLAASETELNFLRRILMSDHFGSAAVFEHANQLALDHLAQAEPALEGEPLAARAALLASQALGSLIFLPQLRPHLGQIANMNQRVGAIE